MEFKQYYSHMVGDTLVIHWEDAPTGATHYCLEDDNLYEGFLKADYETDRVKTAMRRTYSSTLGDWFVDAAAYPDDLENDKRFIKRPQE